MPRTRKVREIVEEARQLPYGERAELIEQLIADTVKDIDPKIEKAWGDEALRRLAEMESGKVKPIPAEEVMARARKIIGRK
jgi:putative addiction module component (TIGR02574 family)